MVSSNCIICDAPEAKVCIRCRSAAYCSTKCQKEDWPLHKRLCKAMPTMPATRPTPDSKLAILFEVDSQSPKLIWVNCPKQRLPDEDDDDDDDFEVPEVLPFLGPGRTTVERMICWNNHIRQIERFGHTIVAHIRDNGLNDGSRMNQAVIACAGKATEHPWVGPIVVLSQVGDPDEPYSVYQDVTLEDLRHITDFFVWYGSNAARVAQEQYMRDMGMSV